MNLGIEFGARVSTSIYRHNPILKLFFGSILDIMAVIPANKTPIKTRVLLNSFDVHASTPPNKLPIKTRVLLNGFEILKSMMGERMRIYMIE